MLWSPQPSNLCKYLKPVGKTNALCRLDTRFAEIFTDNRTGRGNTFSIQCLRYHFTTYQCNHPPTCSAIRSGPFKGQVLRMLWVIVSTPLVRAQIDKVLHQYPKQCKRWGEPYLILHQVSQQAPGPSCTHIVRIMGPISQDPSLFIHPHTVRIMGPVSQDPSRFIHLQSCLGRFPGLDHP